MAQPPAMDADTQAAFQGLNAKADSQTSLVRFLLSQVLILMNDVQDLRNQLNTIKSSVATIAASFVAQGDQLNDIQIKVSAENTAIGVLAADVTAVADLVAQLRAGGSGAVPQDIFDALGEIQTKLTGASTAANSSASSLANISTSIVDASAAVNLQASTLQGVVTPGPAPQG